MTTCVRFCLLYGPSKWVISPKFNIISIRKCNADKIVVNDITCMRMSQNQGPR